MNAHKYLLSTKVKRRKSTLDSQRKGRDEKHYWNVEWIENVCRTSIKLLDTLTHERKIHTHSYDTNKILYLRAPPSPATIVTCMWVNTKEDCWLNVHNGEKVQNGRRQEQKN